MRPITRRSGHNESGHNEIDSARRVVSRAERKALDKAEELRREAEALLQATSSRQSDAEGKAREEVSAEVEGLRAEMEAASLRATEANRLAEALAADKARLENRVREVEDALVDQIARTEDSDHAEGQPARPTPSQFESSALLTDPTFTDLLARLADGAAQLLEAARAAAEAEFAGAVERLADAEAGSEKLLADARTQAEELLKLALTAVDHDSAVASDALEQAENERKAAREQLEAADEELGQAAAARTQANRELEEARLEADRLIADAKDECDRLIESVSSSKEAELAIIRQRVASEVGALRDAMDVVSESLERFAPADQTPEETESEIDLRELSHPNPRQR